MDEQIQASPAAPSKKSAFASLMWWKQDAAEIERQVREYSSLGITKSARGISALLCAASVIITVALSQTLNLSGTTVISEVVIWGTLAFCMFRGQRWAFMAGLLLWTIEKGAVLFGSNGGTTPIVQVIWWAVYMNAFYLGYRVETERRRARFQAAAALGERGGMPNVPASGFAGRVGRLHVGQLLMLLALTVPLSLLSAFAGWLGTEESSNARTTLQAGRYAENPSYVRLGDYTYHMTQALEPAYVQRLRTTTDSMRQNGWSDYQISDAIKKANIPLEFASVDSRASLEDRAAAALWAWPSLLAGVALGIFSFWALWSWFGQRPRSATVS